MNIVLYYYGMCVFIIYGQGTLGPEQASVH